MNLLSEEYLNTINSAPTPTPKTPLQPAQETPFQPLSASQNQYGKFLSANQGKDFSAPGTVSQTTPNILRPGDTETRPVSTELTSRLSPEEESSRFGGPVGSQAYYQYKADHPYISFLGKQLLSAFGVKLPDEKTWDSMSRVDQAASLGGAVAATGFNMARELPASIIKSPLIVGYTIAKPWLNLAQGKPTDFESIANEPPVEIPLIGTIPNYFQNYDQAVKSGIDPLTAKLLVGSQALGDVTIIGSLGEALVAATRPRANIVPGEVIASTKPVTGIPKMGETGTVGLIKKAQGSEANYYSLPKSIAAEKFGGSSGDTFLKTVPAGENAVELSVVKLRKGAIPETIDYLKDKMGIPRRTTVGDFGPEIKLESQIINTGKLEAGLPLSPKEVGDVMGNIPPRALKGFENKPITGDQMSMLSRISDVNGIGSEVRDMVIRTVTGKKAVGELTQQEFVNAAQTLATFSEFSKYNPPLPGTTNIFSQYLSPQRHWTRSVEEASGIPLYSEVYTPMEEATKLRNIFRDSKRAQARDIFGEYVGDAESRRLISSYMRGEKGAILQNETLSPKVKSDLVGIADKMRDLYNVTGPQLDVPAEIFLKDYQPSIQNINGIYQLYKEGSEIPRQLEFFAKYEKKGNYSGVQIDDALALWDIYVNAGSNRMFLNPALERITKLYDTLPTNLQGSVKSYVLEKMGYGGQLEQQLDKLVPSINRKLGINLPQDTARQLTNLTLSTLYSGYLSSPATWFRQTFQYPLFGYARLGPKFSADAIKTGTTAAGMAEAKAAGILVDLGVPYGEELAKDITLGGKALNYYKNATQTLISPNSMADNGVRSIVYHQGKMIFEDALAKYNSGKLNWTGLERELDLTAFSMPDQNIIRQRLTSGDIKGAFNHYISNIVDETSFPYRRGSSARATYGLAGKLGTSLLQWPIEAAHTLGNWAATGQWDKLIRYYAAGAAIRNSMKESFGFDFDQSTSVTGPFSNFYSPFVKSGLDFLNGISAYAQNNHEEFNKNSADIVKILKSAAPAGVEAQNLNRFFKSYNKGPNSEGMYPVLDDRNQVRYYTDFFGLFWGVALGFPTEQKRAESRLSTDIRNAQFDRTQVKQNVLELMQQEKYEDAAQLMQETGVTVGPADMDNYYIPFNQRTFQSLPAPLKAQFAPRVFPQLK